MTTTTEPAPKTEAKAYALTGTLLEACSCNVLCPCWIGEDPDRGYCEAILAYHIETGEIGGVDVSGLTEIGVAYIPGNVLAGSWRVLRLVDERATPEQVRALADAYTGKLGGPLADLAGLVGEELGILQVPSRIRSWAAREPWLWRARSRPPWRPTRACTASPRRSATVCSAPSPARPPG